MEFEAPFLMIIAVAIALHLKGLAPAFPTDWMTHMVEHPVLCTGVDMGVACIELEMLLAEP